MLKSCHPNKLHTGSRKRSNDDHNDDYNDGAMPATIKMDNRPNDEYGRWPIQDKQRTAIGRWEKKFKIIIHELFQCEVS